MNKNDNISCLKGVGEKTVKLFQKINISTIGDLCDLLPRGYLSYNDTTDISKVEPGERVSIYGSVNSYVDVINIKSFKLTTMTIKDSTGNMKVCWYNMPYLKKAFHIGQDFVFVGTVNKKGSNMVLEQPEYYTVEQYEQLKNVMWPIYPLTKGLSNKLVQKCIKQIIPLIRSEKEYLPAKYIEKYQLLDYADALIDIHFPNSKEEVLKARDRLAFDEFFAFLSAMQIVKSNSIMVANNHIIDKYNIANEIILSLPYSLTNAQSKTLDEIKNDISSENVMNRLVQGDVGSGKTIIALLSLVMCVESGFQGALMVPTEVLATQHYEEFTKLLKNYDINIALLTGSTSAKNKKNIYNELKNGNIDIVIGTHAIIQEKVEYKDLGLVITDEQHRFGVNQRQSLMEKSVSPHVMVMSATPIPRTLAIILYGDLDISAVNELPANRLPIKNCVVNTSYRKTAYNFIEKQVKMGRQAYVICPMVEENENVEAENVIDYTDKIRSSIGGDIVVEYLHGKMKANEKTEIMERFAKKEIDILVSTTVIEVGINVPNATVMMIENAQRFGLAQLHQLRGRVGRGKEQSYCIMVCTSNDKDAKERLEILNKSNDGFHIANEDLKLRGPGDFFGIMQSGDLNFQVADIYNNANMIKASSDTVKEMLKDGFDFSTVDSTRLKSKLDKALSI